MKRSEIYLKAAEIVHIQPHLDTTFACCDVVVDMVCRCTDFPELDSDTSLLYLETKSYCSTKTDRDFILLFASELAKDTNN